MVVEKPPGADRREHADRADQVLVHRVVVVHVELHHRDDLAEVGNEAAENARLVHLPEHLLGVLRLAQDLDEKPVRLRILLHLAVDPLQRLGDETQRIRVGEKIVPSRFVEEADEVHRIALENVVGGDGDASAFSDEIRALDEAAARAHAAQEAG